MRRRYKLVASLVSTYMRVPIRRRSCNVFQEDDGSHLVGHETVRTESSLVVFFRCSPSAPMTASTTASEPEVVDSHATEACFLARRVASTFPLATISPYTRRAAQPTHLRPRYAATAQLMTRAPLWCVFAVVCFGQGLVGCGHGLPTCTHSDLAISPMTPHPGHILPPVRCLVSLLDVWSLRPSCMRGCWCSVVAVFAFFRLRDRRARF